MWHCSSEKMSFDLRPHMLISTLQQSPWICTMKICTCGMNAITSPYLKTYETDSKNMKWSFCWLRIKGTSMGVKASGLFHLKSSGGGGLEKIPDALPHIFIFSRTPPILCERPLTLFVSNPPPLRISNGKALHSKQNIGRSWSNGY